VLRDDARAKGTAQGGFCNTALLLWEEGRREDGRGSGVDA